MGYWWIRSSLKVSSATWLTLSTGSSGLCVQQDKSMTVWRNFCGMLASFQIGLISTNSSLNPKNSSQCDFFAVNRLPEISCMFSTHRLTDDEGMWSLCSILPHPPPVISHLSERSSALILAIVPLEFGSYFSWSGLAWLCHCSLLLPSLRCKWEASSKLFGDKLQSGSHWGQIWRGDGIYGMACRVGISVRLYKTEASKHTNLTSNVALEFKSGSFSTEVKS